MLVIYLLSFIVLSIGKYTSGESVYEMTKLSSTTPEPKNCGLPCEALIWGSQATKPQTAAFTCFGYMGPISSLGPLGQFGPLGDNSFSPVEVFKLVGDWTSIKKYITGNGPLDHPKGVLSKFGPMGDSYFTVMPRINDFTLHMQQFGIWSILGPLGPLGALGGLGPLGPIGAHGFGRSDNGDYTNTNKEVVKTVTSVWEDTKKVTWPLFEKYTFERAQELSNSKELDTSFMTKSIVGVGSDDTYVIKSSEKQIISIVIVPFALNTQFVIEVTDLNGRFIASSKTSKIINWVQFQSHEQSEFYNIKIRGHTINCFASIGCMGFYYVHVIGSTNLMLRNTPINYQGQYIK